MGEPVPNRPPPSGKEKSVADLEQFRPALMAYFRKRTHPADVEDLVQQVFLAMHARQLESPIENTEGYLFAVALSALVRKQRRKRPISTSRFGDSEASFGSDPLSPERTLLGKERLGKVLRVMKTMPLRTQEIFYLHRFDEMTYPAIAADLGISVSAVEKHMMAALRRLFEELAEQR